MGVFEIALPGESPGRFGGDPQRQRVVRILQGRLLGRYLGCAIIDSFRVTVYDLLIQRVMDGWIDRYFEECRGGIVQSMCIIFVCIYSMYVWNKLLLSHFCIKSCIYHN